MTPKDPDHAAPPDPQPPRFGTWLRRCRQGLGLTRSVFSAMADLSCADLKAIELRRRLPSPQQRTCLIQLVARRDRALASTVPSED